VANSHEPSYYEIALTNRQVVVAFVLLLVCLVTAFFSGVYIGREGTLRDQEQLVRVTPPAQKPVDQEGQELEEFEFFGGEGNRPTSGKLPEETVAEAEPEPEPSPQDTTLLEDFGGEELAESEPAPGDEEEFVEEEPAPEPEPAPARPRRKREEPRQAATPAPQEEPARPRPGSEPAAPAAAKGKAVIQVFSSAEQDQAERIQKQLAGSGQPAYLSPVKVGGTTMYRVRIGPFDSRDEANKVAERVRKSHKLDTWITQE
jgi:cell division protein FtsN